MKNIKTNKNGIRIPEFESKLRHNILRVPEEAYGCSGISIFGRRIKTFIFSTDIAIIRNCDADAVFAVYPFTPQIAISEAIIKNSYIPVFCGVGGGTTQGERTVALAKDCEAQGAMGVVLNAPVSDSNITAVEKAIDIPVVITVVNEETDIKARLDAGAAILNVAAAENTARLVKSIRERFPDVPIIATGGPTGETIRKTVEAGANAITYTPPSAKELFSALMDKYRDQ
ncbi:MAG: hydrolase [Clostridia bacterium]|nr:hydrolase [Clostridia bacterium]